MMNRKNIYYSPIFSYLKKHYCPKCSSILVPIKVSKIVNSRSPEAKYYDFSVGITAGAFIGDVKFTWNEFKCPQCGYQISVKDLKLYERQQRKK